MTGDLGADRARPAPPASLAARGEPIGAANEGALAAGTGAAANHGRHAPSQRPGPDRQDTDLPSEPEVPTSATPPACETPAPARSRRRWLVPAAVTVLAVLGVAVLLAPVGERGPERPAPSADSPLLDLPPAAAEPAQPAPDTAPQPQALDQRIEALTGHLDARLDELGRRQQDALAAAVAGIRTEQESLAAGLDTLSEAIAALTAGSEDLRTHLDATASATALQEAGDRLGRQLDAIAAAIETPAAAAPTAEPAAATRPTRPRAPQLPFTVLAVDLWGDSGQLTIRERDATRFLPVGSRIGGWELTAADAATGTFRFRSPAGTTARYAVGSRTPLPGTGTVTRTASVGQLTVQAEPADARIRVMNIGPRYRPGMALAAGDYDVLVDAPGHAPWRRWVRVSDDHRVVRVALSEAR